MKTIPFFTLAISILLFAACQANQNTNEKNTLANTKEEAVEEKVSNNTSDILNAYIKLKDALVASNGGQAKQVAVDMLEVIDAIKMPRIQQNTKGIAATDDLSMQRNYFDSLSLNVYEMAKAAETEIPNMYWQFCPMAFDNKGAYWLSFQEEIKNPYFGDKMLKCGRVEEEIK